MAITRTITIGDKKKKPSVKKEPVFKRKRNADGKTLVIVESPAFAKSEEIRFAVSSPYGVAFLIPTTAIVFSHTGGCPL